MSSLWQPSPRLHKSRPPTEPPRLFPARCTLSHSPFPGVQDSWGWGTEPQKGSAEKDVYLGHGQSGGPRAPPGSRLGLANKRCESPPTNSSQSVGVGEQGPAMAQCGHPQRQPWRDSRRDTEESLWDQGRDQDQDGEKRQELHEHGGQSEGGGNGGSAAFLSGREGSMGTALSFLSAVLGAGTAGPMVTTSGKGLPFPDHQSLSVVIHGCPVVWPAGCCRNKSTCPEDKCILQIRWSVVSLGRGTGNSKLSS